MRLTKFVLKMCCFVMVEFTKGEEHTMHSILRHNDPRTFQCDHTMRLASAIYPFEHLRRTAIHFVRKSSGRARLADNPYGGT